MRLDEWMKVIAGMMPAGADDNCRIAMQSGFCAAVAGFPTETTPEGLAALKAEAFQKLKGLREEMERRAGEGSTELMSQPEEKLVWDGALGRYVNGKC